MQQQQQPQTPPNQVPDNRLNEMMERLRQLELQNTALRTTIDHLKGVKPTGEPQAPPLFKPEVEDAIKQTVQKIVQPMQEQHRQAVGYLTDQLDEARFTAKYGGEKYQPFLQKVEQMRQAQIAQNQWVPREQILQMVYFEETGKKEMKPDAPAQTPPTPQEPKFDPYFGTYVDPTTNRPIHAAPPETEEQAPQPMPWQTPQAPTPQPPQQPYQTPPGVRTHQTQHPFGNAYGQQFQLPNQGVNAQGTPGNQPNPRAPLSLMASDSDLKAFEDSFGDIPL